MISSSLGQEERILKAGCTQTPTLGLRGLNHVALDHYQRTKVIDASIATQVDDLALTSYLRNVADQVIAAT
jgi:hypothetical protein